MTFECHSDHYVDADGDQGQRRPRRLLRQVPLGTIQGWKPSHVFIEHFRGATDHLLQEQRLVSLHPVYFFSQSEEQGGALLRFHCNSTKTP